MFFNTTFYIFDVMKRFIILLTLLLVGCKSTPVKVDYFEETDFSNFKQYYFAKQTIEQNPDFPNQALIRQRVKESIEANLEAKGFEITSNNGVKIEYLVSQSVKEPSSSFSIGLGSTNFGSSSSTSVGVGTTIPISSDSDIETFVTINFFESDKPVWSGTHMTGFGNSAPQNEKNTAIAVLVTEILKQYPPK